MNSVTENIQLNLNFTEKNETVHKVSERLSDTSLNEKIHNCLKKHFGFQNFNPGQYEVIENLLTGHDTLAIMPTGGGKSLCYQIPALLLKGVTIVVSPLISLMKDQFDKLCEKKIPAAIINSTISQNQVYEALNSARNNTIKLLYIAPERFNSQFFKDFLNSINISLFAIDEAHCISQWGHDFRPSYLKLKMAINLAGNPVVGAFTATATPEVRTDILNQLGILNPKIIVKGFDRPNIKYLTLLQKETDKKKEIVEIIKKVNASTIIYCSTKKITVRVTEYLQANGINCAAYHAGLDNRMRDMIQNNFFNNTIPVIVATNAFGMGIDKSDIRLIIHYNMPGSIEALYQESGRAGRDGKTSYSLILGNRQDLKIHHYLINSSYPTEEVIKDIYNYLFDCKENPVLKTYKDIADSISGSISELTVGNTLKILESYHLIKRLHEKEHPAYISFLSPFEIIIQRNRNYEIRKKIINYFQRLIPVLKLNENYPFSPENLIKITEITKEQFQRNIKNLDDTNEIIYSLPFSGRGIEKITSKTEPDKLPIDFLKLEENRQKQLKKLDIVNNYLTVNSCKRAFLLNYFGEKTEDKKCNGCDICLNWRPDKKYKKDISASEPLKYTHKTDKASEDDILHDTKTVLPLQQKKPPKNISENDIKIFYCCLLKYSTKLGLNKFIGVLRGSKDADVIQKGLSQCSFYGKLSHITRKKLIELFTSERKKGYVKKTPSRLYPKIFLTDAGKEKVRAMLEKAC